MTRIYEVVSTRQIEKERKITRRRRDKDNCASNCDKEKKRNFGHVEDYQVQEKIIVTRIGEVISTRQRYDCNKDRQSDIDEAKRRGE